MNRLLAASPTIVAMFCVANVALSTEAPPVQLVTGEPLARADLLQPAVHRYLRYTVKDGKRSTMDIWTRALTLESDGTLRIRQRWDGVARNLYTRHQESTFQSRTLMPLQHRSQVDRAGQITLSAFRFQPQRVIGDHEVSGNSKRDFVQKLSEPVYNFETDIELLQALPLALGYAANIPFYDPGLKPPARYVFRVAGEVEMSGPDGTPVSCWLVTTDFNRPGQQLGRFWIAKRNQILVREEVELSDGELLVKALLPPEAAD